MKDFEEDTGLKMFIAFVTIIIVAGFIAVMYALGKNAEYNTNLHNNIEEICKTKCYPYQVFECNVKDKNIKSLTEFSGFVICHPEKKLIEF